MQILNINLNNHIILSINGIKHNNTQRVNLSQSMPCDSVQFTGAVKELSNEEDKALLYALTSSFDLDGQQSTQLKNVISNFIQENKLNSLGDINEKSDSVLRKNLADSINQELKIPDELSGYVMTEIIHRCSDGEEYTPMGLRRYNHIKQNAGIFSEYNEGWIQAAEMPASDTEDDKLYSHLKKVLRLSSKEAYQLREFVEVYLEENGLGSIESLFKYEEASEMQGGMEDPDDIEDEQESYEDYAIEDIMQKFEEARHDRMEPTEQEKLLNYIDEIFDFSEHDMFIINKEFEKRASTNSKTDNYVPATTTYAKDAPVIYKIIEDGGYDYAVDNENDFSFLLYTILSADAEKQGYRTLFDFIKSKDAFKNSDALKFINTSKLSEDQKSNLIIDLAKVAKNYNEYVKQIPKHPNEEMYMAYARISIIKNKIVERFDIKENKKMDLDLLEILRQMFPINLEGKNLSPINIAFLISNKYSLSGGAEKEIIKIINDVQKLSDDEVEEYLDNCK